MEFDLDDDDPVPELVAMPSMTSLAADAHQVALSKPQQLRQIEDRLLNQHLAVVEDMAAFRDIDPETTTEPPMSWVKALGREEAEKRLRVAKATWKPVNKAPVGLSLSTKFVAAAMKARALQGQGPRELNLQVQFIHAPMADYSRKKVGGR